MSTFQHADLVGHTIRIVTADGNDMVIDVERSYNERIVDRLQGIVRSVTMGRLQPGESVVLTFTNFGDRTLEDIRFTSDIENFTTKTLSPGHIGMVRPQHRLIDAEEFEVSHVEIL